MLGGSLHGDADELPRQPDLLGRPVHRGPRGQL